MFCMIDDIYHDLLSVYTWGTSVCTLLCTVSHLKDCVCAYIHGYVSVY